MKFNSQFIAYAFVVGMLVIAGTVPASAAIVFSENFEGIDTSGGPVNLVAGGTPNSAFGQNVAIVTGSGTHQIRAVSDTTPFFVPPSTPNNYLQFVDGGNGQPSATGQLSSQINSTAPFFRVSFDMWDSVVGTDNNYIQVLLTQGSGFAGTNIGMYSIFGSTATAAGPRAGNMFVPNPPPATTAGGPFENVYPLDSKVHVDIIGSIDGSLDYAAGPSGANGAGSVPGSRQYDIWINGALAFNDLFFFSAATQSLTFLDHITVKGNNTNGLATLNLDNIVVETIQAVPEPSTYLMSIVGMVGFGLIRMRKR